MRWKYILVGLLILALCLLISCGMIPGHRAAAPLSQRTGQVAASLTALPEELAPVKLLARQNGIVVWSGRRDTVGSYEIYAGTGAYRAVETPLTGEWEIFSMAPSPDGGMWMILEKEKRCVMMKISTIGAVVMKREMDFRPESIVCDSSGHVFLAAAGEVWRLSPTGELQGHITVCQEGAVLHLAAKRERVFVRSKAPGEPACYMEIMGDMSLGDPFKACMARADAWPIGSFLPEYTVMERDDVGLYACREDGCWETVCLWSELRLNGTIEADWINDAQGRGNVVYVQNGLHYCLTLYAAE